MTFASASSNDAQTIMLGWQWCFEFTQLHHQI